MKNQRSLAEGTSKMRNSKLIIAEGDNSKL